MILIFYLVNIVALLLKPLQLNKIVLSYSLETLQKKIRSKDPLTEKKVHRSRGKKVTNLSSRSLSFFSFGLDGLGLYRGHLARCFLQEIILARWRNPQGYASLLPRNKLFIVRKETLRSLESKSRGTLALIPLFRKVCTSLTQPPKLPSCTMCNLIWGLYF